MEIILVNGLIKQDCNLKTNRGYIEKMLSYNNTYAIYKGKKYNTWDELKEAI